MPHHVITIPFDPVHRVFHTDVLNEYCINKRIIAKQVVFFQVDGMAYWSIFLEYEMTEKPSKTKRKGLRDSDVPYFEQLRMWRKQRAAEEGVPTYFVASDRLFVNILNKRAVTSEALRQVEGFGESKMKHYAKDILAMTKKFFGEDT